MPDNKVVSHEEQLKARLEPLAAKNEFARPDHDFEDLAVEIALTESSTA
jgi:hypothetical protein